jgi:hypothetical protein
MKGEHGEEREDGERKLKFVSRLLVPSLVVSTFFVTTSDIY